MFDIMADCAKHQKDVKSNLDFADWLTEQSEIIRKNCEVKQTAKDNKNMYTLEELEQQITDLIEALEETEDETEKDQIQSDIDELQEFIDNKDY